MKDTVGRGAAPPRRPVLADGTYESIKAMILDHEISPGARVGIDELARTLSVSQTPIREALARLEADGLVLKIPQRGYQATDLLSVRQFDELFQFRAHIEPWAASEAARRATRRDIESMTAELTRVESLTHDGATSTYARFVEHDTRLHTLIAQASGNAYVADAFVRTHCHMHLLRVYKASVAIESDGRTDADFVRDLFAEYYQTDRRPLALSEHDDIIAAIARGDGDGAHELMLAHIESSRRRFITAVEALNALA